MDKYIKKIYDKHSTLLVSFLLNVIVMFVLILIFDPHYDVDDDIAMSNLVDGSKGMHDTHLIFINSVIGYILKYLYIHIPIIPWYAVLQYIIIFVSFTACTFVMLKRLKTGYTKCVYLIFLTVFSFECYIFIQFSKTAAIASVAGVLLLLAALALKKISKGLLIIGYVLSLTGACYRLWQFYAEVILLSGIGLFLLFRWIENRDWKRMAICFGVFFVLLLCVLGLNQWDHLQYQDKEWAEYMEFNELRSQLYDYGFPTYEGNEEVFEKLGIDQTTMNLLWKYTHLDPDRITIESLRSLVSLKEPKKINWKFVVDFFKTIYLGVYCIPGFLVALLFGGIWLFYNKRIWQEVVTVLYEFVMINIVYVYLFYSGRFFWNRVDMGLWMAVALVILWLLDKKNEKFSLHAGIINFMMIAIVSLHITYPQIRLNKTNAHAAKLVARNNIESIHDDSEHLYMTKIKTISTFSCYGPFERIPEGTIANICPLGGWASRSATENNILKRYGVENPFKDIINNEKMYVLDDQIDITLAYIQKWYASKARAEVVKDMGAYKVYRIVE